ncbi:MAG: alkylation response protein AidB-like acyl-CoA dehydrogenase, partial [Candidatus Azotimanducaceae bacterium]
MPQARDTQEQSEFRAYCRAWLEENRPPPPKGQLPQAAYEVMTEDHRVYLCDWQSKCYAAGLIATDVDKRYGGHGYDSFQQIAGAEVRRAKVPYFINWIGLGMTVPTLMVHGTEEQKETYFPKIFSGEEIWCQGFSEPDAGSDLASLQASAIRDGDNWVINGRKVWTSLAHFASHILLLARTDKTNKHGGITYFLAPMDPANGVNVRPIHKLTGESGFNEVTFDNMIIPDKMRVDAVGAGWKVAMSTLTSERGAGVGVGAVAGESPHEQITQLIELAKNTHRNGKLIWDDLVIRDRIVKLLV